MRHIVLLSGPLCSGRSKLASRLRKRIGASIFKTTERIDKLQKKRTPGRIELQNIGKKLDKQTRGKWIYDEVCKFEKNVRKDKIIVVDSVYNEKQVRRFRQAADFRVSHIHLWAPDNELDERYKRRLPRKKDGGIKFKRSKADFLKGTKNTEFLKNDADIRVNTFQTDEEDTFIRSIAGLGLFPSTGYKCVDVLIGGQFGSEGKGNIAAYLAKEYDYLVRVGGPNAGHTVFGAEGKYTYHQLPSGCRDVDSKILIGPGAVIDLEVILREINECKITSDRLYIDPQAMIIDADDKDSEAELARTMGSTARGVGAATSRKIMGRTPGAVKLARDIVQLREYVGVGPRYRGKTVDRLQEAYSQGNKILLEGTQGAGLSLHHGQYPYVTSRETNVSGCLAEAGIPPFRVRKVILVIRSFPIRVADPGNGFTSGILKIPTTFEAIATNAGLNPIEVNNAEKTSTTGRDRRVGHFDWELFRLACQLNEPTDIALTFVDYFSADNQKARRFDQLKVQTQGIIEEIQRVANAPVSLINTTFPRAKRPLDRRTLIDRRTWGKIQ